MTSAMAGERSSGRLIASLSYRLDHGDFCGGSSPMLEMTMPVGVVHTVELSITRGE
ncbi:hypothetical protein HH308_02970 [Gordonia sp. TBRC 11910]|uniref:Uncharacterized protein n=1 Tax=Gordonia asplenii TaxID=2725283 RepID=A0A848KM56_9ACTN|nr:hypothetical protein [Gordonia asplenii]NMO00174.1 hypothetical protein [Gordonia asplenii]